MSWLAPFYLAGFLAVAAPIVFHLWRRTPRGRRVFSTLMFLRPSPPRMTTLSKVEHWSLLCLRALALLLIALAFARPIWRVPATTPVAKDDGEFLAILLDTSASMQREGVWSSARDKLKSRLDALPKSVVPAFFSYDDRVVTQLSFAEVTELDPAVRNALLLERAAKLAPTWQGSRLGEALVRTAQALQEAQAGRALPRPQRILLISDLQAGSDLSALRAFDWPADIPVEWVPATPKSSSNAGLQLVASSLDAADARLRVRVTNDLASTGQQFTLHWGDSATDDPPLLTVLVPPGQGRVVSLPDPPTPEMGRSVILHGDDQPFDNLLWLPRQTPRPSTVLFVGDDAANDPSGQRFYLERALATNPQYRVTMLGPNDPSSGSVPDLIVATKPPPEPGVAALLARHPRVLLSPADAEAASALFQIVTKQTATIQEARVRDYSLWTDIDFESPWFAPFAEAQFADFSGIHFWKHRQWNGGLPAETRSLVRFDDGDPAVIEWRASDRRAWLFLAGWHPADSQLARSSKFVPLIWRVLEHAMGDRPTVSSAAVGEPLPIPPDATTAVIRKPDDTVQNWTRDNTTDFIAVEPGLYAIEAGTETVTLAVNVPAEESRTDPLAPEQLEAFGVKWSTKAAIPSAAPVAEQLRQQQLVELEHQQQLWRWALLAAIVLIGLESVWAGWRQSAALAAANPEN